MPKRKKEPPYLKSSAIKTMVSESQYEKIQDYFRTWLPKDEIRASDFAKRNGLTVDRAIEVLCELAKEKILKYIYTVQCPSCGWLFPSTDKLWDIEREMLCAHCNKTVPISTDDVLVSHGLYYEDAQDDLEISYKPHLVSFCDGNYNVRIKRLWIKRLTKRLKGVRVRLEPLRPGLPNAVVYPQAGPQSRWRGRGQSPCDVLQFQANCEWDSPLCATMNRVSKILEQYPARVEGGNND